MTTQAAYLALAQSQVGTVEIPQNQVAYNTAYYGRVVNGPQFAWCQALQWWLATQLGMRVGTDCPAKTAYCPTAASWYQQQGRWSRTPQVGSQVLYDFGSGVPEHTGVVVATYQDGSWDAVEGNTDGGGSATGGQVMVRHRGPASLGASGGFGRMTWDATTPAPAALPVPASKPGALVVDGQFGYQSTCRLQSYLRVAQDGVIGPQTIKALQALLGVGQDGVLGQITIRALQRRLGVAQDGSWGPVTSRALQTALNAGRI